ncbi:MAG TPA: sensor histidine kinase, partial [Candidatus Limnocylindrales bacterium]
TPLGYLLGVIRARLGRGRLADLATALGRGIPIGGLRDVLARAIDDPTLELAFADGSGAYRDSDGQLVEVAGADGRTPRSLTRVERDGRLLAVLVHDPVIDTEDPGLVAAVGSMAALALDNERLAAEVRAQLEEVRASRARIAEAADDERRRVERDLHDGAQQRLVALTMRLEQARASGAGSAELIDTTTAELREAIGEVRQIARGMHPPILTESGLAAAVESLAERMPLPVAVRVTPTRVPPQIEAAAYYVVAEALTNAVRHAGATAATVDGQIREGRLELSITDDGLGGAEVGAGTGLQGLRDRLAAVDGTFIVTSAPGAGTTIRASMPIADATP